MTWNEGSIRFPSNRRKKKPHPLLPAHDVARDEQDSFHSRSTRAEFVARVDCLAREFLDLVGGRKTAAPGLSFSVRSSVGFSFSFSVSCGVSFSISFIVGVGAAVGVGVGVGIGIVVPSRGSRRLGGGDGGGGRVVSLRVLVGHGDDSHAGGRVADSGHEARLCAFLGTHERVHVLL